MVTGSTIAFGSGGKWFWLLLRWLFVGEWWLCEFGNREINYMNMKPKSQVCWCVAMVDMWRRLMVCWSEFNYEVIDSSWQRCCLMEEWSMWSLKKNGVWISSSRVKREFMCMWKERVVKYFCGVKCETWMHLDSVKWGIRVPLWVEGSWYYFIFY